MKLVLLVPAILLLMAELFLFTVVLRRTRSGWAAFAVVGLFFGLNLTLYTIALSVWFPASGS